MYFRFGKTGFEKHRVFLYWTATRLSLFEHSLHLFEEVFKKGCNDVNDAELDGEVAEVEGGDDADDSVETLMQDAAVVELQPLSTRQEEGGHFKADR